MWMVLVALITADVSNELLLQTGHSLTLTDIAFATTHDWLASAGADRRVLFWDPQSALTEHHYTHRDQSVSAMAWSKDDQRVALGTSNGDVTVLDFPALSPLIRLQPSQKGDWVTGLAFVGDRLVIATWEGVFAYDTSTWQKVSVAP